MTYKIPESVKPVTDAELAKLRRSLILFRHPNINNDLLMKMVRRIECQDEELKERDKTIRLLTEPGKEGFWPNWGNNPNGFDGPGGAE